MTTDEHRLTNLRVGGTCRLPDQMSLPVTRAFLVAVLSSITIGACNRAPAGETRDYPAAAARTIGGGLVGPLKDDSAADIVSWVDGSVVTDWPAESAKRDHAIDDYLND